MRLGTGEGDGSILRNEPKEGMPGQEKVCLRSSNRHNVVSFEKEKSGCLGEQPQLGGQELPPDWSLTGGVEDLARDFW